MFEWLSNLFNLNTTTEQTEVEQILGRINPDQKNKLFLKIAKFRMPSPEFSTENQRAYVEFLYKLEQKNALIITEEEEHLWAQFIIEEEVTEEDING